MAADLADIHDGAGEGEGGVREWIVRRGGGRVAPPCDDASAAILRPERGEIGQHLRSSKVSGWPRKCRTSCGNTIMYCCKRLESAQPLGRLGVFAHLHEARVKEAVLAPAHQGKRFAGLAQNSGQLSGSHRGLRKSNCWANITRKIWANPVDFSSSRCSRAEWRVGQTTRSTRS